jgi:amino acid adenylation domain-containing protein
LDRPENLPDDEAKLLMSNPFKRNVNLPPEQAAIRAKCFHPKGKFVEFKKEEVEQSIPERFEKIVRQFPARVAVKTRNSIQTYDELNKTANRIARAILAECGEDNEPIAVLLEQGAAAIAAILAALKAGKIVVPLDSSYPRARTSYMLEHSQAAHIVTNNKNYSLASELARNGIELLNIDDIDVSSPTGDPEFFISPDVLAYILYTSGSTGQPKGVLQNHRNVLHQIMIYTNTLRICAEDRLTLLTSVTGQAINTMLVALLNGAAVYPFNFKDEGPARLAEWLGEEEITIYSSVATLFCNFAAALAEREQFPKLRLIYLGGEPIRKTDVELYKRRFFQGCLFVGRLGISEVGTVRYYFVDKETQIGGDLVPLGYAVEDMEIVLLDYDGREVGFDQIGEIAVKSRHLSPGYWRNPEATHAALVKDPKGGDRHIYLTGDLGRMSPDGCLIHCGRKDFRVKVRGYNVEPAETERALLNTDNIKDAVVVGHEHTPGDQRLVAYLVPNQPPAPSLRSLRRALAEKLPDYMIPAAFVFMEALPRTPNGKINRHALPPPSTTRPELDTRFAPPRTPVESVLAGIWSEILGVDAVGIHDDFFELGGHSLAATRVVSRVITAFQLELPLQSLFQAPTIAAMAAVIDERQKNRLTEEELGRILTELETMSEEEAKKLGANNK